MKWSLKNIKWISGILIVLILVLVVFMNLYVGFNVIIGILIALLIIMLVILIIMGWREHNNKKAEKQVLIAVKNELEYNLQILGHNQSILDEELELIEDNKFSDAPKRNKLILAPLLPLKTGFWNIIIVDLFPDEVKKSELFVKIRDIDMHANKINQEIKSRENYKIANIEAYDISSMVKNYDKIILKDIEKLRKSLMNLGMQIYKLC